MLTKKSTFEKIMNYVTTKWFKTVFNERSKQLVTEFQQLASQIQVVSEQFKNVNNDVAVELDKIRAEISYLENADQIKTYAKTNSFNTSQEFFKDDSFSFKTISEFLQRGESISQVLVKIQIGETFKIADEILNQVEDLKAKIGQTELLENIVLSDVDYLLSRILEPYIQKITEFISHSNEDLENILVECNRILSNDDWKEKLKNIDIVERYFKKFKVNSLFSSFNNPQDLENENTKEELIGYSKILVTLNSAIYLIKFADCFNETFTTVVNQQTV